MSEVNDTPGEEEVAASEAANAVDDVSEDGPEEDLDDEGEDEDEE